MTRSASHERRYSSAFSRSFFPLSLSAFYPAHPCGTANVSQGLPGTRTVTKWNGRKNEWKTIKEESAEGGGTVGGNGKGSEKVVEQGKEKERRKKKTEGRPPSGLIKSITSSLDLARDSPPLPSPRSSSPPSHSRPFSLTPNSHNCSFFPLRRSSSYDGPHPLVAPPRRFLRGHLHRSRLFTLILILLPAVRLS